MIEEEIGEMYWEEEETEETFNAFVEAMRKLGFTDEDIKNTLNVVV